MANVKINAGEEESPLPNEKVTNENELCSVVDTLPTLIKQCVDLMDTPIEKKMALYATTVIAGSLLPKVHFVYDLSVNYTNLYSIIIFPPASGKGRMALLPHVLDQILKEQMERNALLFEKYKIELKKYEKLVFKGEQASSPTKPKLSLLLIPGNTTSSKLIEQLAENDPDSMSLIYETETDALTYMMNSKFGGNNSMILRNGFHNESIQQMRKMNSEHLVANTPKVSLVLTGTASQLPYLFRSTEDGTFSRFLVLQGGSQNEWKDVSPCEDCIPINQHIKEIAKSYYEAYKLFKDRKIEIKFTPDQWDSINLFGKPRLKESESALGAYATSIPKRHALMIAKMASIFTAARYFENQNDCTELVCSDVDFENSLWLVKQSYESSIILFESLSKTKVDSNAIVNKFFEKLNDSFQKKELAPVQHEMKLSNRTIDRYLEKLVNAGKLVSSKKGRYEKVVEA